jgi:hypothetical protein
VHQLFGTAADWWETYRNTHLNTNSISWNEFKARFRTHYVPHGTHKLKKKEFSDLNQMSMTVNEYLNQFIQLSRYAIDDVNTNEKKQDMFLKGLNDEIQFHLLNTDYLDFQHLVDKAVIIENKIKEMKKDSKRKTVLPGQHSRGHTTPRFSQPVSVSEPHFQAMHRCMFHICNSRTSVPSSRCSVQTIRHIILVIKCSIPSSMQLNQLCSSPGRVYNRFLVR